MSLNNKDGIDNKTVELKLFVPGNTLFSQADAATFEAADRCGYGRVDASDHKT